MRAQTLHRTSWSLLATALLVTACPALATVTKQRATWVATDALPVQLDREPQAAAKALPYLRPAAVREFSLAAVGDVIPHRPLLSASRDGDGHDFGDALARIGPTIAQADVAVANLETPLAGADLGFTGYPLFNAPVELASALVDAGFDVLTTANNHSLDRRERGVRRTIEALDGLGVAHAGTAATAEPGASRAWFDTDVGRVALLSWTYGTNGILLPPRRPWLVNTPIDEGRVAEDIRQAREDGAVLVLLALHWGNEYQAQPAEEQRRLARAFAEAGADAVLGGHPHVLQPAEILELEAEDGRRRQCLVVYSLGNFLSNQRKVPRDAGLVARAGWLHVDGFDRPQLAWVDLVPTWVDATGTAGPRYRVLRVDEALRDCEAQTDADLDEEDCTRLASVADESRRLFAPQGVPATAAGR